MKKYTKIYIVEKVYCEGARWNEDCPNNVTRSFFDGSSCGIGSPAEGATLYYCCDDPEHINRVISKIKHPHEQRVILANE